MPFILVAQQDHVSIKKVKNTHWEIYTELTIGAPAEKAWEVLTNFSDMPNWSTGLQKVEGELKNGGKATAYFLSSKGKLNAFEKDALIWQDGHYFGWQSPFILGLKDHHIYEVRRNADGTTFIHRDQCKGFMALFLGKKISNALQESMIRFNEEFKTQVLSQTHDSDL